MNSNANDQIPSARTPSFTYNEPVSQETIPQTGNKLSSPK